jgi:hypothetical protein
MGFKKEDLKKAEHPLYGFGNKRIEALGKIDVNVSFGQDATMRTEVITFDVVDFIYPYNAIFGRNTINKFAAVIHQGYLRMKIPKAAGVISVYGSQEEPEESNATRRCTTDRSTSSMKMRAMKLQQPKSRGSRPQ